MDPSAFALPIGALIIGAVAFGYMWWQSRAYDRKHPRSHHPAGE